MLFSRRAWLLALVSAPVAFVPHANALSAQQLAARLDGDYLRIAAPHLTFLTGKTLDRLHDGAVVSFVGQISLSIDGNQTVQTRSVARFAVSYDIWEEKFTVVRLQQSKRTASHLSLEAAQNWVFDNLALNASALPQDRSFWLRFDFRAEDSKTGLDFIGGSGIDLTRLVEVFSRPAGSAQPHWTLDGGPYSFAELRAKAF
jgi:hypothetical protein